MPPPGFTLTEFYGIRFRPGRARDAGHPPVPHLALRLLDGSDPEAADRYLSSQGYRGLPLAWLCFYSPEGLYWALAAADSVREPGPAPYPEAVLDSWADSIAGAAFILGLHTARMERHQLYCRQHQAARP